MNPHEQITSTSNPRVRQAARLREADARRETGLTLVDGRRELARAAAAGVEVVIYYRTTYNFGVTRTFNGALRSVRSSVPTY